MPTTPADYATSFEWQDGTRLERLPKPIGYGVVFVVMATLFLLSPVLMPHADNSFSVTGLKPGQILKAATIAVLGPIAPLRVRTAYRRSTPLRWTVEPGRFVADWGRGGHWEFAAGDVRLAVGRGPVRLPHKGKRPVPDKPTVAVFDRAGAEIGVVPIAVVPIGGIDAEALARALAARGFEVAGVDVSGSEDGAAVSAPGQTVFPPSFRDRLITYQLLALLIGVVSPVAAVKFHDASYLLAVPIGILVSPAIAWLYDRERPELTISREGVKGVPHNGKQKLGYDHPREMIGGVDVVGSGSRTSIVVLGLDGKPLKRQGIDAARVEDVRRACAAYGFPFRQVPA